MKLRKLSRRSFLTQVAGGAAAGAGALIILTEQAGALQTDSDPGDRPGQGRTGINDSDPRDRPGYGRGGGRGVTDRDPSDPANRRACSDSDRGNGADPIGRGRRCGGGRPAVRTTTDRDSGPRSDPPNRRVCSDSDRGRGADPVGRGRRC